MRYYNIHTHKASVSEKTTTIVNRIIGEKETAVSSRNYLSYGIHPWYIHYIEEQKEQLHQYIQLPHVVAVGEAGLDKFAETDILLQEKVFFDQILLAEESGKPLIIHCVKAWTELIEIKKKMRPQMHWIIHGFRGNGILADQLVKQGMYLSFGVHFNPQAIAVAWPDHILAETDDSEMDICNIYSQLADSLNIPLEAFASQLAENVNRIFLFD